MTMTSPESSAPQRFAQLALALNRHMPGYVNAYSARPNGKSKAGE